ncbi:MAG TPA: phosphate signaling complex protein PhoU [Candidatus Bathyarchaeia archaeon]|nr:phosphate signaling complex protein PhoU [Candidatus Bathyarchaeia archaeon]
MERHFHEEVGEFHTSLLKMASLAEQGLEKALQALKHQDKRLAEEVIFSDQAIDDLQNANDEQAIDLLALHQPMAIDLRMITTGMYVNSELEMIGDLIVNIAQRAIELADKPLVKPLVEIEKMVVVAKKMIRETSDAFIRRDSDLAKQVIVYDKESNRLRDAIVSELIYEHMVKDGSVAPRAVLLILAARDLERICDHCTAIAEDVIYMIQARTVKHHRELLEEGFDAGTPQS